MFRNSSNCSASATNTASKNLVIRDLLFVGCLLALSLAEAWGQASRPEGRFLADTVKVGEPVAYVLVYRHPASEEIRFPEDRKLFEPFELVKTLPFPTRSDSSGSVDSVVYMVQTFELTPFQQLAVPVLRLENGQELPISPLPDSVFLQSSLLSSTLPDSLAFYENLTMAKVERAWNVPLIAGVVGGLLLLLALAWIVFGKKIKANWLLKKLTKRHAAFLAEFDERKTNIRSSEQLEALLATWKLYMGELEKKPYPSATSREIQAITHDSALYEHLKRLDKAIYSGRTEVGLEQSFEALRTKAESAFAHQLERIQAQMSQPAAARLKTTHATS